jgi:catechol 2,3-dioxygenase-like lactoylglutathione lyase family enzyme
VPILGLDHVQIALPAGSEEAARRFYGGVLGLEEIPKPDALRARGGAWFRAGDQELHLGVEEPFSAARKAHPGLVADDLEVLRTALRDAGVAFRDDRAIAGVDRLFVDDPFGNRLEIRAG